MEETVGNLHLEANEFCHLDVTPNQSICKETKNLAVTAEEIIENSEYVVMHRSIAVQTFANEEIFIPKQYPAHNQSLNLAVANCEGGSIMEIDLSSQESVMDIASQESASAKESTSEGPHSCNCRPSVSFNEEAVFAREQNLQKRELAVSEHEEKLKIREEDIAHRERAVLLMEEDIRERQESLNNQEKQIIDREMTLKKRETEVQIRELEAIGYKVIPGSRKSNGNSYEPTKRAKKN